MKILILPGDGIGPEIMAATRAALDALNDKHGLKLAFEERAIGLESLDRSSRSAAATPQRTR